MTRRCGKCRKPLPRKNLKQTRNIELNYENSAITGKLDQRWKYPGHSSASGKTWWKISNWEFRDFCPSLEWLKSNTDTDDRPGYRALTINYCNGVQSSFSGYPPSLFPVRAPWFTGRGAGLVLPVQRRAVREFLSLSGSAVFHGRSFNIRDRVSVFITLRIGV